MNDRERLDFLEGQIHAFTGFAAAVIYSHPNLPRLAEQLQKIAEINLARAEGDVVSDAYVDGLLSVKDRLKSIVETALAPRTIPKE